MKTVARIRKLYVKLYERWYRFWSRHAPPSLEHVYDRPLSMPEWDLKMAHDCPLCGFGVKWVDKLCWWLCPHCCIRILPAQETEKRPAIVVSQVLPIAEVNTNPRHTTPIPLSQLPEQRAVHVFSLVPKTKYVPAIPGQYVRKINTGEIELRDGKPYYKNGPRVTTEQFKMIFPSWDESRRME